MDKRTSRILSRQVLLVLAGLAVMLVLSGLIGVGAYQSHVASVNATATRDRATISARHVQATLTATEQNAEASATANAQATATEQAQSPYGGTLVASDPMSGPETTFAWFTGSDSAGNKCSFQNNAYHVVGTCESRGILAGPLSKKFAFEVHLIAGSNYGVIFLGLFAQVSVYQGGQYFLSYGQSIHSGSTSAMRTGPDQSNSIGIVVDGTQMKLYINDTAVDSFPGDYTTVLGLSLGGFGNSGSAHPAEVIYSNARLWSLQ